MSYNEKFGFFQHAIILADDELPIVIPNMHITQIFSKSDFLINEPEYEEYLQKIKIKTASTQKSIDIGDERHHRATEILLDRQTSKITDGRTKATLKLPIQNDDDRRSPVKSHPCGCSEEQCGDCWCQMADSRYLSRSAENTMSSLRLCTAINLTA